MLVVALAILAPGCHFFVDPLDPLLGDGIGTPPDARQDFVVPPLTDGAGPGDQSGAALDLVAPIDLATPPPPPDLSVAADLGVVCSTSCQSSCKPCCSETCSGVCSQTCSGGCGSCGLTCSGAASCDSSCSGGSTCAVKATATGSVSVNCSGGATCSVECDAVGSCSLACSGGSHCLLQCSTSGACSLTGCSPVSCPSNVQVCNRACP